MVRNPFDLSGKVAIVTGSNTGLGQSMAVGLAQAGADIVGVARREQLETEQKVSATGRRFHSILADVSQMTSIDSIINGSVERFSKIDILVNNAGIIRRNDALDFSEQDWDEVMDINIKSLFFLSQAFARQIIVQGTQGNIINIASMLSFQGGIRVPSYTASKSALMGLTRAMANEWAAHGINVNGIAPGYMSTNNTAALREDGERYQEILNRIPAGRWGTSEDISGPAVFLASEASRYINGFILAVDGGWLAR
ncbi:2-dehydro-3-deoxy-D-gluconate 5-dehydrogenase KduD [Gynuella sunshinyii]|uniref:2-dehydro-3-deoxy-D-gluconate 5-dehydrogenase n=1 Tax=Gynuella sunshinyii YC6258 TaxID=1445510 RepID=A0A0C5V6T9_9GAMM|nr:2-dehydro-3-deoxy-D-gluconate 5-dehydrogenase KduD [Gynuella sunshinyii]AJQ95145.1 dehydrogenases with different specificities (related to short-chain alcohol dehydrogenase) [Gynuella sunshinyii YC6258]